jgi:hypothetical protein
MDAKMANLVTFASNLHEHGVPFVQGSQSAGIGKSIFEWRDPQAARVSGSFFRLESN